MEIFQTPIVIFMLALPIILLILLYPAIHIKKSKRTVGTEKVVWVFMAIFFNWFALLIYYILSPINTEANDIEINVNS